MDKNKSTSSDVLLKKIVIPSLLIKQGIFLAQEESLSNHIDNKREENYYCKNSHSSVILRILSWCNYILFKRRWAQYVVW